jgi:hypothetical protein
VHDEYQKLDVKSDFNEGRYCRKFWGFDGFAELSITSLRFSHYFERRDSFFWAAIDHRFDLASQTRAASGSPSLVAR